jgi:DNA-directed RNA polymerase specialized sigma24 family protein
LWKGKNIENLLAYAVGIAMKLREDARLDASRLRSLSPESAEASGCMPQVPDEGLRNLEREELLERALRRLEDSQQGLFDLLFVRGNTNEEARQQLAVSKLAFRGRKHRLLCRLRVAIQEILGTNCVVFAFFCDSRFCA